VATSTPGIEPATGSRAAILGAAAALFARHGPDGVSLRDVAAAAGCSHTLVMRRHGAKDDLVAAVATRTAACVDGLIGRTVADSERPVAVSLHAARTHRDTTRLLIRTALGDLPGRGFPECLHLGWLLAQATGSSVPGRPPRVDRRSRVCAYAAASLALGFVTFEGFVVAATRLGSLAPRRRDEAVAGAVRWLLQVARQDEPSLAARDVSPTATTPAPGPTAGGAAVPNGRDALLAAAIELFAERGPASVSVRDIARHAGANQGLIYRHFGSKAALLAAAIEQGSSVLFPAALAGGGFDFDTVSWLVHRVSPAPRLIARILVDGIDIRTVRRQFPVLRRLVDDHDDVPTGAGPGDLSDPRVAVAAAASLALGSAVWGDHLRPAFGLDDAVESAVSDLARLLVAEPGRRR
jgi:AcrR family transcriptional regulator